MNAVVAASRSTVIPINLNASGIFNFFIYLLVGFSSDFSDLFLIVEALVESEAQDLGLTEHRESVQNRKYL